MLMMESPHNTPVPQQPKPADDALYLYMRMQQMEKDMEELRKRNSSLEDALKVRADTSGSSVEGTQEATASVSGNTNLTQSVSLIQSACLVAPEIKELTKETHALTDKLRVQAERIKELESSVAFYKKKLEQSEELLYELQWDPSQDLVACREKNDNQTVEELQEKKIFQLLEQMRVMESGLQKKQETIEALKQNIELLKSTRAIGSNPTSPALNFNPALSFNPASPSPNYPHYMSEATTSPVLPTTTKENPEPTPQGWLSFLTGSRSNTKKGIVQI